MDVSDIFYFFLLGEGEGGVRGAEVGGGIGFFFFEDAKRGGSSRRGRGREGVCGELGNSGLKCPPRSVFPK